MKRSQLFIVGACLLGFSVAANATPIAYTSEADWLAALGSNAVIQVENFESSPVGVYTPGPTDIGLFSVQTDTNDPTAASNRNQIAASGFVNGSHEFQAFIIQDGVGGSLADTSFVDLMFDTPFAGFGGDFFSTITGDLLLVTVNGVAFEFDNFLGGMGNGFFGIVDLMAPITSIRFTVENPADFGEFWAVDEVQLAAIPEPDTLALLALALSGLAFARKRRMMMQPTGA